MTYYRVTLCIDEFFDIKYVYTNWILFFQGLNYKKNYQIHLKSTSGSINVLLVNKDTEETSPVVVQVPPPQDDPQNQNIDPDPKNTGKQGKVGISH